MGNVQRAPQGLLDLLSLKGVESLPKDLAAVIQPTLDVLQFYAAQQRSVQAANNGALAEGATLGVGPFPQWLVLYAASMTVTKTATMTALEVQLGIRLNSDANQEIALRAEELGPFGATETGTVTCVHWCPYPLLLPPNTLIIGRMGILGTDAAASCVVGALVGILG